MSRTNQNVYWQGEYKTFAASHEIITKLRANKAGRMTQLLYFYIVEKAKGPTVRITTSKLMVDLPMDAKTFRAARRELTDHKVIRVKETSNGIWEYELLSPEGRSLPTANGFIRYEELSAKEITAFYEDRFAYAALPKDGKDNIAFRCPYCHHKKAHFRVHVEQGDGLNGLFICGNDKCGQKGGMVEIEQHIEKRRTGKTLDYDVAAQRVRSFFLERIGAAKSEAQRAEWEAKRKEAAKTPLWYMPAADHVPSQNDDFDDDDQP